MTFEFLSFGWRLTLVVVVVDNACGVTAMLTLLRGARLASGGMIFRYRSPFVRSFNRLHG